MRPSLPLARSSLTREPQVEDLFFNTPTRLKSLRSSSDEYARIVSVLLHYSIHNAGVAMVCKKAGSGSADVSTQVGATVLENIGVHYGEAVRRELVEVDVEDVELGVKAKGWFSGANYGGKKGTFLFFINRAFRSLSLVTVLTDERRSTSRLHSSQTRL